MEMTFSQMVDCREKIIKNLSFMRIMTLGILVKWLASAFSKSLVTQTHPQGWSIHNNISTA